MLYCCNVVLLYWYTVGLVYFIGILYGYVVFDTVFVYCIGILYSYIVFDTVWVEMLGGKGGNSGQTMVPWTMLVRPV